MKRLIAPLIIALVVTACASAPRHQATVASGALYNALAATQDTESTLHRGGQITDAQHRAFAARLVPALEAGRAFNAAVAAWPHGSPTPPTLKQQVDRVIDSTRAALATLPPSPAKDALIARVLAVVQVITDTLLSH